MNTDRVPTGIGGLDIILNGGFVPGSVYLVEGVPGAGKTTLGLQFIYSGIVDHHQNGLIVSFEEFPEQMERDARGFGWDLRALQSAGSLAVLSTSPESLVRMMEEPGGPIDQLAQSGSLQRVLVDSVTHFQSITSDAAELRKIVFAFLNGLRRLRVTALLTKEIERDDPAAIPFEEYLVDGVIRLSNSSLGVLRRTRSLEVLKSRGQPHLAGRSGFRFGPRGLDVFPRLSANWAEEAHWLPETEGALREEQGDGSRPDSAAPDVSSKDGRVSTGVSGIDLMLTGGLLRGSSAMIAGTSGTGKTLLCLEFLHAGLSQGEPGVILTVEENARKLIEFARSVGLNLQPYVDSDLLQVQCCSPADVTPGEALWKLYRLVRSHSSRRVVIDSLNALFGGEFADAGLMQPTTQNLMHLFETMHITTMLTWEIQDITGNLRISDHGLSAVVDSLVLLRYVETGSEMRRIIGIIKSRGTNHDPQLREFFIGPDGFKVESKIAGVSGVLQGSARGVPKKAVEELLQPLVYIQDLVGMLERKEIPEEKVQATLQGVAQETERVMASITEYLPQAAAGGETR